jgi:Uma2 family endonuclease
MTSAAPKLFPEPPPGPITDDLIPDDCELLDGSLVEKETSGEHGHVQMALGLKFLAPFQRRPGGRDPGGWWFASEVLIDFGPGQRLRPDVSGWRRERSPEPPHGAVVRLIPDWICEILSTGNPNNDLVKKRRIYHQHRVHHYWIVDPLAQRLEVYRWHSDGYLQVLTAQRGERVRAEPFEAVPLTVGVLFGDDDDEP